ncbi:MAG: molecular chaperone DnaJ, partial [Acidimicrobiaceae bacterium]|nr:molecular chaperone DnaJ [Acidimicrobiaceae bacterium]
MAAVGTLYDELGVPPGASEADLRRAYRRQARLRHPDVHPTHEGDAEEAMRRLNSAWSVLGDPAARRRYDETLSGRGRTASDPPFAPFA